MITFTTILLLVAAARAQHSRSISKCPTPGNIFINAGGKFTADGYRCDVDKLWTNSNHNYATSRPVETSQEGCLSQYKSHKTSHVGDLRYTIPVPLGTYTVDLMFMENWAPNIAGKRRFTISVNDKMLKTAEGGIEFDIFSLAGGIDIPYMTTATQVKVVDGNIAVVIGRIRGAKHPMISGIVIEGAKANSRIGSSGKNSCKATTIQMPGVIRQVRAPQPAKSTNCSSKGKVQFLGADHTAHAVSGGPYLMTNFKSAKTVAIKLDGTRSHSHGTKVGGGAISITNYIWTWRDAGNPAADASGAVKVVGPTPIPSFPVGTTRISLEVYDENCDRSVVSSQVTIIPRRLPGAYCYYYDFLDSESELVPIEGDISMGTLPSFAVNVGDIDFRNTGSFGALPFKMNSFAARCVFSIESKTAEPLQYRIMHSGPIAVYTDGQLVAESESYTEEEILEIPERTFTGVHEWQILYFRPKILMGRLRFLLPNDAPVPTTDYGYDASKVIPVVTRVSREGGPAGASMKIFGSGFFNNLVVTFGVIQAETTDVTAKEISVRVPNQPNGAKNVQIEVSTNAGKSNRIAFEYPQFKPCQSIQFKPTSLKNKNGRGHFVKKNIIVIKYGPDGRLYGGTAVDTIFILDIDSNLRVRYECERKLWSGMERFVTGIAFNAASPALKMYMSTATPFWRKKILSFEKGWTNGKVQSISVWPYACFKKDLKDVVTGLPVSRHDHVPSWIQFLPDGRMLVSIASFTNGGISIPTDKLGGIPDNPYSGSIISCPSNNRTDITYTNTTHPDKARVKGIPGCSIYATGFRNAFGGYYSTNSELYCLDQGPNFGYGDFSFNCKGGHIKGKDMNDLFHKVQENRCHGHPNIPRGIYMNDTKQCVFRSSKCVKPLWDKVPPSATGIVEYRSNLFDGLLKGNIFLTAFSNSRLGKGAIHRLILDGNTGNIKPGGIFKNYHSDSGLTVVEGPRGELIMNRYQKSTFYVLQPVCGKKGTSIYLIGIHPKRGPAAGGHKVLISGFNFGTNPTANFGNMNCRNVKVIDSTQFTCITPPGTPNTQVKVVIAGPSGETNIRTMGIDYWYF